MLIELILWATLSFIQRKIAATAFLLFQFEVSRLVQFFQKFKVAHYWNIIEIFRTKNPGVWKTNLKKLWFVINPKIITTLLLTKTLFRVFWLPGFLLYFLNQLTIPLFLYTIYTILPIIKNISLAMLVDNWKPRYFLKVEYFIFRFNFFLFKK